MNKDRLTHFYLCIPVNQYTLLRIVKIYVSKSIVLRTVMLKYRNIDLSNFKTTKVKIIY